MPAEPSKYHGLTIVVFNKRSGTMEQDTKDVLVLKLPIDKPTDFKFHLAYTVYSEVWDRNHSEGIRSKLNETITSLSREEISYQTFYAEIQEYRGGPDSHKPHRRTRIESQRKRDWQRSETRIRRNKRYTGR